MFERYTEQAKRAIDNARTEAALRGAKHITPSHLLLGLSQDDGSRAAQIASLKGRLSDLWTGAVNPDRPPTANQAGGLSNIPLHPETKMALVHAEKEANREWSQHIDTDHLLRGLLRFKNEASDALKSKGVHLADVRTAAKRHRIQFPSARSSFFWMLKQMWRITWPVVWRLALLAAAIWAVVYAIHHVKP
jgi:ATP-dependent Clp protease ATP-binding subunit ClpA